MSARIFLALFLVGAILENVCGSPYNPRDEIVIDDMRMKREQFHNDPKTRQKRMAWSNDYKWPKSGSTVTIPYTTSGVDEKVIKRATEVFKSKTCIRLVPRNGEANYLAFQSGSSCGSDIGYRNSGAQAVQLTSGCAGSKGKVMHEVMHSLGFLHEQCRPDRNSYVTINTNNIRSGAEGNFAIQTDYVDQNIPYDCDSILHYSGNAFSSNDEATITINNPNSQCSALGNGDKRLSLLDYKRINTYYACNNPTYTFFTVRVVTSPYSVWQMIYGTGTDCFIYLKLHGTSGTSSEFELDLDDAGSSDLFERGSDHTFSKMVYKNNLGSITGISVRLVDNGNRQAWLPTTFTITDHVNAEIWTFTNAQWLNEDNTYGPSYFTKQTT